MLVTTILVGLVMLIVWKLHPLLPAAFLAVFLILEGIPASALLYKVGFWVLELNCEYERTPTLNRSLPALRRSLLRADSLASMNRMQVKSTW